MTTPVRRYYGTPRNAPTAPMPRRLRPRALVLAALVAAGIALAGAAGRRAWTFVTTSPGFAVRHVEIRGACNADSAALAVATRALGVNVFELDLGQVRQRLLSQDWIADATVQRLLPDGLRADVVERIPVAIGAADGGAALLDAEGEVIAPAPPDRFRLPSVLTGPDAGAASARRRGAATLAAVRAVAPAFFAHVRDLDARAADRLALHADGFPTIYLAGPESAEALAGYLARAGSVRREIGELAYVDARWRDRLFVLPQEVGPSRAGRVPGTEPSAATRPAGGDDAAARAYGPDEPSPNQDHHER